MATIPSIQRGEDVTLELTLTYEDGTAVNLSSLNGYKVVIFQDGYVIEKFSKNAASGYSDIVEITPLAGIFEVNIQGANTVNSLCNKEVCYNIKLEIDDTDFTAGVAMKDSGNVVFAIMKESKQRDITSF